MIRFKNKYLILFFLVITGVNAQMGVGTKTPNSDAMLEVSASNKGLLLPRVSLSSTTSASPLNNLIAGMTVYNTATTGDVTPGYYYCDGVKWVKINAVSIPDATTTLMGKIQLTGDLGGTASLPTVPGLTLKVDKEVGKGLSSNDYTTAEKTKLGAITGTNTGDQTTITGNAGTATKLAAAKNINGVAFDGSADITVTSAAGTLTGAILASNVLSSSLTSVGTLIDLTVTNPIAGSITGNAATVTTNANLTGEVTSLGNATTVTNAAVIGKVLTGFTAGTGTVAATDTVLQAIQKIDGNDALKAPLESPTFTGIPTLPTGTIGVTQTAGNSTTALATTAFVTTANAINANLTGPITSIGNATTITDSAVTNAKLDKTNIPLSGFGVPVVDVALGAKKLTGVADPIDAQDAATKAYVDTKTSKVQITSTEIVLPIIINTKQLYSISGTLTIVSGTSATIPEISGLTEYYSIRIFKDGKPFRNEVRSFTVGSPNIVIITGNGMMSEIYPSGTYTYVLEYFK